MSYRMKKYERVRFFECTSWQYLRHLKSYSTGCHLRTNKLYGAHAFQLIRCYRSEFDEEVMPNRDCICQDRTDD